MCSPRWAASPKLLVGVDVAGGSLELASRLGYTAVLADAAHTPFRSEVADIVVINASLHHCDDMDAVLREGARLVKPNGLLITDHDPQLTAWDYKGLAKLLWDARLWVYRATRHGFHKTGSQQSWGLRTEVHHQPGDGVTKEFFQHTLEPLGFEVSVHPHNHQIGADALKGQVGPAQWKYRMGNVLSGRDPAAATSALSLMCIARRVPAKETAMAHERLSAGVPECRGVPERPATAGSLCGFFERALRRGRALQVIQEGLR
jgi:SAM-dependent methyltransferase